MDLSLLLDYFPAINGVYTFLNRKSGFKFLNLTLDSNGEIKRKRKKRLKVRDQSHYVVCRILKATGKSRNSYKIFLSVENICTVDYNINDFQVIWLKTEYFYYFKRVYR